ncbi:MAG: hypothetical protein LAT84_06530 [Balneolia bacterium]|nr:hypothetical protein [Balneolia bacterium]
MTDTLRPQLILMDPARVKRTVRRMAFQLAEGISNPENVVLVGLNVRGQIIASLLGEDLSKAIKYSIPVYQTDVNTTELPEPGFDTQNKDIILVDDVLFSGRTMSRALSVVSAEGEPERIRIAVLVDRGHRTFPLYPEVSGMRYPTKFDEHVEVVPSDSDQSVSVLLFENS